MASPDPQPPAADAGPPRRRRLTKEDRRTQLLAVAESVFAEVGFEAASLEEIASRAGVTRGLMYNHFRSKDELYVECVRAAREELQTAIVAAAVDGTDPEQQLRLGLRAYFEFVQRRGERWDILFGTGAATAGPVARQTAALRATTIEQIAALIDHAVPGLDRRHALAYANACSGAAAQVAVWWREQPEVAADEIVELLLDTQWRGLGAIVSRQRGPASPG
jgi:AcrR family transcriptional regulator